MISFLLASICYFFLFASTELISRKYKLSKEITRKFIHIVAGTSVACLPLFMSRLTIEALGAEFFIVMLISRSRKIFNSIHGVERLTYGELLFPVAVILAALLFKNNSIYAYAILVMALGDGMASVIGKSYGKTKYNIAGAEKSYVGSAAFFFFALFSGILVCTIGHLGQKDYVAVLLSAIICTLVEGGLSYGLDNIAIPVVAGYSFILISNLHF